LSYVLTLLLDDARAEDLKSSVSRLLIVFYSALIVLFERVAVISFVASSIYYAVVIPMSPLMSPQVTSPYIGLSPPPLPPPVSSKTYIV
jgi:hypothetical protein